jgi:hypothetical protein
MSFFAKCVRCREVAPAVRWEEEDKTAVPEAWGTLRIIVGPTGAVPWKSDYNHAHLCPQCLVELADFLRGCKINYEAVERNR